ncbi:MAG: hypothetical protein U0610_27685, partial [bacterium]
MWIEPLARTDERSPPPAATPDDRRLLADLTARTALETLAPSPGEPRNRLRQRALELASAGQLAVEWSSFAVAPIEPRGRERDNARGEERERSAHPEWYRFLDARAPNHALKRIEAELYLGHLRRHLGDLGEHPRLLDLG